MAKQNRLNQNPGILSYSYFRTSVMTEQTIYNKIGIGYNYTRRADPYIAGRLYSLLAPQEGNTYLDIGCGTGNYTIKLAEMGVKLIGIDPSELMLAEAKNKYSDIQWLHGQAEHIPLADNSVDGAIATLTIHHWKDIERSFSELARVMKTGSSIVIFTFTPEQEEGYWFNHFFPAMMQKGIAHSMSLDTINKLAKKHGFKEYLTEKYFVHDGLEDMFGYSGKNDPERYFDPAIIKGISYFSIYADPQEVKDGLLQLRESIDNGSFQNIKKQYENDLGDYLFIVLKKS